MNKTSAKIARNLDLQFAEMGFAVSGVDDLRDRADVSLRTLYKYYPSREAMVVGALSYRNEVYLDWIKGGPPLTAATAHILYPIRRLGDWLEKVANTGCLFQNALAAYPDSAAVSSCVKAHKALILEAFKSRLEATGFEGSHERTAEALYLIHEGLTAMAMVRGPREATRASVLVAQSCLERPSLSTRR